MRARRGFSGPTNANRGPKYRNFVARQKLELGVRHQFPELRSTRIRRGYEYRVTVPVPHYEARGIRIRFNGNSEVPSVFADGPEESPHRYPDGSLCMWYPEDPIDHTWVFDDGLLHLIGLAMAHLFREAWWRETGEWVGEEVSHVPQVKERSNE